LVKDHSLRGEDDGLGIVGQREARLSLGRWQPAQVA
jgi:hypothetical protein